MKIEVSGRHINVGEALRRRIEEKITEAMAKHAHRPVEATARLSKDAYLFRCDCAAHLSTGLVAQASGEADDAYAACDAAVAKLEKQLRRHQRRLKDHHQRRKQPIAAIDALAYVLESDENREAETAAETSDDATPQDPIVVAEDRTSVLTLTVGDAVMQMDLSGENFLLFVNEAHQRLNAVYRRSDGNIGWLDPQTD